MQCADARDALLQLAPAGDVAPAGDARGEFLRALGCVATDVYRGVQPPDLDGERAFFDVHAPTDLVQCFCSARPHTLGVHYDASEVLESILAWSNLENEDLFNANSGRQSHAVLFRGIPDSQQDGHLCDGVNGPYVVIDKALNDAFADGEDRLVTAPKILAVVLEGRTYGEAGVEIYDDYVVSVVECNRGRPLGRMKLGLQRIRQMNLRASDVKVCT